MSQMNTDSSVPNGMPSYKWEGGKYMLNNGVGSSQSSSRDSSPVPRFSNVPPSQLPPSRTQIPSSQLPPGRMFVKSANSSNTPDGSPYVPMFTSTPKIDTSVGNITTGISLKSNPVPQVSESNQQNGTTTPQHQGNLLTNQEQDDIKQPMFMPVSSPSTQENDNPPSLQPSSNEQVNIPKPSAAPIPFTQLQNQKMGYTSAFAPVSSVQSRFGAPPTNPYKPQSGLVRAPAVINPSTGISQQFDPPPTIELTNQPVTHQRPPITTQAPPMFQGSPIPNQGPMSMSPINQGLTGIQGQGMSSTNPSNQGGLFNQGLPSQRLPPTNQGLPPTQGISPTNQILGNQKPAQNPVLPPTSQGTSQISPGSQKVLQPLPPTSQAQGNLLQGQGPINQPPTNQGHPQMNHGPPPLGQGLPIMNFGQPPMSQGQPSVIHGAVSQRQPQPQISQGQPIMNHGQSTMNHGQPPMSQGVSPMNQGQINSSLPSMNHGVMPTGQGPPVSLQSQSFSGRSQTQQFSPSLIDHKPVPPPTSQYFGAAPPRAPFVATPNQNQQFGAPKSANQSFQPSSFGIPPTSQNQQFGVRPGLPTSQPMQFNSPQPLDSPRMNPGQLNSPSSQLPPPQFPKTVPTINQYTSQTATLPTNTIQSPKSEYGSPQPYPSTPTAPTTGKRYPQTQTKYPPSQNAPSATYTSQYRQNTQGYQQNYMQMTQGMTNMNLQQTGFNRMWGAENFDLLQCPNILPAEKIEVPRVCLGQEYLNNANCSPDIFRCTMTKIPDSNSLLQKSRLPLGVLIHPFKDLNHLPVIQCSTIVRCRACRTYINPFVFFVDTKRWKCNLCYRVNELPEEFQYDPVSKSYGDPSRRPEIKASTIEYIAPSEYMLRPPQPAVYLFLLDISRLAIESGYLHTVCEVLSSQLATLPGDSRTQIGFLCYNSTLHFFSLGEGLSQPHEMTVLDIDDVFLPCPDNLLVNLKERMELVTDLLALLPTRYINSYDNGSALGAALQAAFKMMGATGGRVSVFQAALPTLGPGALAIREDPNQRAGKEAPHLNPATDFYKRLALECSGHQVAVDMFIINSQYVDIATLSGISRFSGGCMHHFPLYKASKPAHAESLERCFKRYLTRKVGFEAVMRIRCTRGLAVHTFHGNFFVRSTDLLSLPNVNPDAGFGLQVSIEESLSDLQSVCFQAALLYTSSKGERRIRVHTLCLPVVSSLTDVLNSADQQCIVGMLAKMAVDRSMQSSLSDARDAFINVAIDILQSYKGSLNMGDSGSGLLASHSLKLLPLYILALLKHIAFRSGHSTRLDDRVFAMCEMKTLPLYLLIQHVYPDLYSIHNLTDEGGISEQDGLIIPRPPRLQLTARNVDSHGVYLLDCGQQIVIFVCQNAPISFLTHILGVPSYASIPEEFHELPKIENPDNQRLHTFINSLNDEKPYCASLHIIRENSPHRTIFLERLIEDRIESALSYNEFLQHIKTQVK